ncbi:MAG: hypothetical protein R3C19_00525 [Planctomycetaceae bacterium]
MNTKTPAVLAVVLEAKKLRWSVAAITSAGEVVPLVQSQSGDLAGYVGLSFDEQTSYLRHRLAGAVQRGCDRMWGRSLKPSQFVFVQIGAFQDAPATLAQRIADHFCQWMVNPPTAYCLTTSLPEGALTILAGEIAPDVFSVVQSTLTELVARAGLEHEWEIVPPSPGRV